MTKPPRAQSTGRDDQGAEGPAGWAQRAGNPTALPGPVSGPHCTDVRYTVKRWMRRRPGTRSLFLAL